MTRTSGLRDGDIVTALAILFLLPSLLFAFYLAPWPRLAVVVGVLGAGATIAGRPAPLDGSTLARPVAWGRLAVCAIAAVLLILLGGEGHLLFANWDWLWRDAVLADLTRSASLPVYQVDGTTYWLRAPLGMYLLPALVGRLGALGLAHGALAAQNAALLAGLLYLLVGLSARRGFVVLLVFVAFSGLDIVGTYVAALERGKAAGAIEIPSMIESWAPGMQYSSAATLLFWVPNHCLPGWWLAVLALTCARGDISLGEVGLGLAGSLLWSPLAALGALPIVAVLLACRLGCLRELRFWLCTLLSLAFVPIALYLVADSATVPHSLPIAEPGFWMLIAIFLLVEIPHVFVLSVTWRRQSSRYRPVFAAAIVVLVLLPMVRFGDKNDLLMRGSIPALAILAFAFGEIVAQGWRPRPVVFTFALAIALIGAVTPALEIERALRFPRFAISSCNLLTAWKSLTPNLWLANYLGNPKAMPAWLVASRPPRVLEKEMRQCWPDLPFDPRLSVFGHSNAELEQSGRGDATRNFPPNQSFR